MNVNLAHLKDNSAVLRAERAASTHRFATLAEQINTAAAQLSHGEKSFGLTDPRTVKLREALRKLKQERAGIKLPSRFDPYPDAEAWHRAHPNIPSADPVPADIRKGETGLMAFNRRQQVTAGILSELASLEATPPPPDEACEPLFGQIDELANKGKPRVAGGSITFPKTLAGTTTVDNAVAVIAWLHGSALKAAVRKMLDDGTPTIPTAERERKLAKLRDDLVVALRQECACATEAERQGQRVERRRDIHAALLLGLRVDPAHAYRYLKRI